MEEGVWLVQLLREQCELLEIVLLYYKDYDHLTSDLCEAAKRFQVCILEAHLSTKQLHESSTGAFH